MRIRDFFQKYEDRVELQTGYFYGDLRNMRAVSSAIQGVDAIFHLGGQVSHVGGQEEPFGDANINIIGTVNVLEAARKFNPKALIAYASSRSVYGKQTTLPIAETATPQPIDNYGIGKLACEHYMRLYAYHYGLRTFSFRQANVVGPRQQLNTRSYQLIGWVYRRIKNCEPLEFWGSGEQTRDFLYVGDACAAYIAAAKEPDALIGHIFNLPGKTYCTWLRAFGICGDVLKRAPAVNFVDYPNLLRRQLENPHSQLDGGKVKQALGWEPKTTLAEAFTAMDRYYSADRTRMQEYMHSPIKHGAELSPFTWI